MIGAIMAKSLGLTLPGGFEISQTNNPLDQSAPTSSSDIEQIDRVQCSLVRDLEKMEISKRGGEITAFMAHLLHLGSHVFQTLKSIVLE